jgi:hypothetical protein
VAEQRIHARGATTSDATAAIAVAMAVAADPWPEATVVDTTAALDRCAADAVNAWYREPNSVVRVLARHGGTSTGGHQVFRP